MENDVNVKSGRRLLLLRAQILVVDQALRDEILEACPPELLQHYSGKVGWEGLLILRYVLLIRGTTDSRTCCSGTIAESRGMAARAPAALFGHGEIGRRYPTFAGSIQPSLSLRRDNALSSSAVGINGRLTSCMHLLWVTSKKGVRGLLPCALHAAIVCRSYNSPQGACRDPASLHHTVTCESSLYK